jgi:lipopolysaccharide biosynthesis glycosyltransferase
VSKSAIARRNNLVVNISKLWLNKIFSDFDSILWIDADAWVQDFSAIETLFGAAQGDHLAIVPQAGRFWKDQVPLQWIFPWFPQVRSFLYKNASHAGLSLKIKQNIASKAPLNAGVFALNSKAEHWQYLQDWQSRLLKKGKIFTADQMALSLVIHENKLPVNLLSQRYNYMGPWRVNMDTKQIVEYYFPYRRVGIIHLAGEKFARFDAGHRTPVPDTSNIVQIIGLRYNQENSGQSEPT